MSPQQALVWAPPEGNWGLRLGRSPAAKPSPSLRNNLPSHLASEGAAWAGRLNGSGWWWCGQLGQAPSSLSQSFTPLPQAAFLD